MFNESYNAQDYSNTFKIRHLVYSPKIDTDESLQIKIKKLINDGKCNGDIYTDSTSKTTIRATEDKDSYLLVFFSECDHKAKVAVTPDMDINNESIDRADIDNLDTYQVFMLIDKNEILANIQIANRKVYTQINRLLKFLNINGSVHEALNIQSIDIIEKEGIRGFEISGSFSSVDLLDDSSESGILKKFFNAYIQAPPPIVDSQLIGKFQFNISDNTSCISEEELKENPEKIIPYLGQRIVLVTGKGKKLSGQDFVQEETFYLRPYTKNSVSRAAAFATLCYYKERL